MKEHDLDRPEYVDPSEPRAAMRFPLAEAISDTKQNRSAAICNATRVAPPAETEMVVDRIARFIERFVFLKTKSLYQLLALWTMATHIYSDFEYMGYIFACSPEPQSGKSRLLEILELLVANPSGILVSPSEAVLFRTAEGQTQLLDEADGWTNRDELKNILKAGFHAGGKVPRMLDNDGKYEVQYFPVYAPRALAGIGNRILDDATRDRTFVIDMVRQTSDERREQLRLKRIRSDVETLKGEMENWIKANRQEVVAVYDSSDFSYLAHFRDRTIDVTQPLAAIVEVCYKKQRALQSVLECLMDAVALTRKDHEPLTDDHRIIKTLAELARSTDDPLVGNVTELADSCALLLGEKPEAFNVSAVLRRYGFEPRSIRKGGDSKYRYSLPLDALEEILKRYGSPAESKTGGPEKVENV